MENKTRFQISRDQSSSISDRLSSWSSNEAKNRKQPTEAECYRRLPKAGFCFALRVTCVMSLRKCFAVTFTWADLGEFTTISEHLKTFRKILIHGKLTKGFVYENTYVSRTRGATTTTARALPKYLSTQSDITESNEVQLVTQYLWRVLIRKPVCFENLHVALDKLYIG